MNDLQMKEMIDKLKKEYDNMPTKSSSAQIMSQITKEKRPRWGIFFHKWQMAAVIVLALGIGGVLTMGQLNDFGSTANEEMSRAVESRMAQDSSVAETEEVEQDSENHPAVAFDVAIENRAVEESVRTEVITIEGMEETIRVKTLFDDVLHFSTIVDERYEIETAESEGEHSLQVYANYTGERIEPSFFRVMKHSTENLSVGELEASIRDKYALPKERFTERKDVRFFDQNETELHFVSEISFEAPDSIVHVGIVEEETNYYTITVNILGEMEERMSADTAMMLKHARFEN